MRAGRHGRPGRGKTGPNLKPCPVCGMVVDLVMLPDGIMHHWRVEHPEPKSDACPTGSGDWPTVEEAVGAWGRLSGDDSEDEQRQTRRAGQRRGDEQ